MIRETARCRQDRPVHSRETLNNSPTRKREAGEADLIGKQAGFFYQLAVFAWGFPHFPFSGRTLGVGVEQPTTRQHQISQAEQ